MLGALRAVLADGGHHGEVEIYEDGDSYVLVNLCGRQHTSADGTPLQAEAIAASARDELLELGVLDTPSGSLFIGLGYIAWNRPDADPDYATHADCEKLSLKAPAAAYKVSQEIDATLARIVIAPS